MSSNSFAARVSLLIQLSLLLTRRNLYAIHQTELKFLNCICIIQQLPARLLPFFLSLLSSTQILKKKGSHNKLSIDLSSYLRQEKLNQFKHRLISWNLLHRGMKSDQLVPIWKMCFGKRRQYSFPVCVMDQWRKRSLNASLFGELDEREEN